MRTLLDRVAHYPNLAQVITLWVAVLNPPPAVMAAVVGTVGLFVHVFSASKLAVTEAHQEGYNAALADVSSLQPTIKPPPLPDN